MTNAHAFDDVDVPINQQGNLETREVVIGDDVWIGTRVIIMPGVTIGSGSVIGAGSIVTKDIPGMSIAVGNPARVIRNRGNV
jgi:maltose O-acetyltransferase